MEELTTKKKLLFKASVEEIFNTSFLKKIPTNVKNLEIFFNNDSKILKIDFTEK